MKTILANAGSVVGWAGIVLCLITGTLRFTGSYYLFEYEAMTVFIAGIGLILAGCFAKLEASRL